MPPSSIVDAVVVGAGIAGASVAWALAPDHRVMLVEQEERAGHHATGRSASTLSETSGTAITCALAAASRPFFESVPDGFVDVPLLSPRGLAWVGTPGDEDTLDRLADAGARVRSSVRRLDAAGVAALVPVLRPEFAAVGGVHEPDAMAIDVDALLQGYLRGLRRLGGRLELRNPLVSAQPGKAGWTVRLADGTTVSCSHVVNAAGAWGDEVARRCGVQPLGLRALRRTAAIVPAGDEVRTLPLVMDVANRFYFEPEPGGLLVSPADETATEPCDAQAEELDVALALERIAEATTLTPRHVRRAWAGMRTFTNDRSPVAGGDGETDGFVWLVGQGGAGIKTAPAMALAARAAVTGEPLPERFEVLGLSTGSLSPARVR
jgi:D-arginine dehydrogenase